MFGQNKQVNLQKLSLTFEALGAEASFRHMRSLNDLNIKLEVETSRIEISSDAFHGLTQLKKLDINIQRVDELEKLLKSGLLAEFPNL
jgi:hypothetical protein